ncbi:hypothetical protein J6590_102349 [Homalodisca vitripennis]|nr:hypothetical protein J6590_102349 [Homalodisca vitripennis]
MPGRQVLKLNEIEELVNDPEFIDYIDLESHIDIVQLPPDTVDDVSDLEEIDYSILDDTLPTDVPGKVELHYYTFQTNPDETVADHDLTPILPTLSNDNNLQTDSARSQQALSPTIGMYDGFGNSTNRPSLFPSLITEEQTPVPKNPTVYKNKISDGPFYFTFTRSLQVP